MLAGAMKLRLQAAFALALTVPVAACFPPRAQAQEAAPLSSLPARHSPDWLNSGIVYQVFVRSFSPAGDLNGVTARLDGLHELGVNILWLMPIHPSGQIKKKGSLGSPYAVRDYYAIDPALGTQDDFRRLVQESHRRQMKVIIDIVANHTSWDSVLMAHPDFYKKDKDGHITYPYDWTDVAALDYSNPQLRRYMIDMLIHWIKQFDLDGFRCDAAAEVPTDFWEQARKELERVKPDIMLLAEAQKPELLKSAFDMDYAWPLMHVVDEVIMNGAPASGIRENIEQQRMLYPHGALHLHMTDDHDELRATTRYGYAGAIAASLLMFTLDGAPLVYNGMEVGDSTQSRAPALFEPQKVFWDAAQWHPDYPKFYAAIAALRREHRALQQGEIVWVHNSDEQHVISFLRRSDSEELLIAVNLSNSPFRGTVEASPGDWKEMFLPLSKKEPSAIPSVSLNSFGARIFARKSKQDQP
jgi:cyclomaltodextrinase